MKRLDLVSELLVVAGGAKRKQLPLRDVSTPGHGQGDGARRRQVPEGDAGNVGRGRTNEVREFPKGHCCSRGAGSHLEDFDAAAFPKVLLHACCAPCSGAILEALVAANIPCTVFYSNDNIVPREEYDKRLNECLRYAEKMGVEIVEDPYDHERWLCEVSGLETEPERGRRCQQCFMHRLSRAARYAAEHGFPVLTTTLASSRWKDLEQVNAAGLAACALYPGVTW